MVWYIPPSEGGSSIVILSQTRGGVWEYFTEGSGKYNDTTPNFGGRYDILIKHIVYVVAVVVVSLVAAAVVVVTTGLFLLPVVVVVFLVVALVVVVVVVVVEATGTGMGLLQVL